MIKNISVVLDFFPFLDLPKNNYFGLNLLVGKVITFFY